MSNNETNEKQNYTQRFQFIRDDVFLIATINPRTEIQNLIFTFIDAETNNVIFTDRLRCIHTSLAQINLEKYEKLKENPETQQEFIKQELIKKEGEKKKISDITQEFIKKEGENEEDGIKRKIFNMNVDEKWKKYFLDDEYDIFHKDAEKEREERKKNRAINLSLDEKFFAFKSWVQGIAEAGMDALRLQSELDAALGTAIPIAGFLFKGLLQVDPEFIFQFLAKIDKECRFDGVYHKSSLRANLDMILQTFEKICYVSKSHLARLVNSRPEQWQNLEELDNSAAYGRWSIFENAIPDERWQKVEKSIVEGLKAIAEIDNGFLFDFGVKHPCIRKYLIEDAYFKNFKNYGYYELFYDDEETYYKNFGFYRKDER